MKKLCLLVSLALLTGCFRAGDYNILPQRNDIFTMWNGHKITFYETDGKPTLLRTERVEERNFKPNVAQTVYTGYSVLNSKVYKKNYYAQEYMKPNKNGALNSASLPIVLKADKKYKLIGEVTIDGQVYRMIPGEMEGYAALIDENGGFYKKIGQIDGDYLVLLDTEFFPYPADLKMVEVKNTKVEQSEAVQGFDVKYDGVKLDRIWFTYLDYDQGFGDGGVFKNISFPNKPGLITINNIGFRVLQADNENITYMVLTE